MHRTFRADYRFHIAKMRLITAAGTLTRAHVIVIGAGHRSPARGRGQFPPRTSNE